MPDAPPPTPVSVGHVAVPTLLPPLSPLQESADKAVRQFIATLDEDVKAVIVETTYGEGTVRVASAWKGSKGWGGTLWGEVRKGDARGGVSVMRVWR